MRSILVIDDEEGVRDAFEMALAGSEVDVRTAPDGSAGLAAALEQRPDLVILDLRMPGLDGVETLTRLIARDPTLRIHILTAFHAEFMQRLREAAERGLCFEVMRKPLDADQIRALVLGLLGDEPAAC